MVSGIWMMAGGRGLQSFERFRDFSRSGNDISESGEGREIFDNIVDAGWGTETFEVEIFMDTIGFEDVSSDAVKIL